MIQAPQYEFLLPTLQLDSLTAGRLKLKCRLWTAEEIVENPVLIEYLLSTKSKNLKLKNP